MNRQSLAKVAALAASCIASSAVSAATIYTSEAAFVADVGNAKASLPSSVAAGGFTAAPFSFTPASGQSFVISTPQYGQPIAGEDNLLLSGYETHFLASSVPLYAFGFTLFQPANAAPVSGTTGVACYFPCEEGLYTVRLLDGATLVGSFSFTTAFDTLQFRGYAGSSPFDTIEILDTTQNIDDEYFANYRYSTAPVPLPAALWLLFAGLGAFGWVGRRRS